MNEWLRSIWDRLHSTYWFVPALMAVGSVLLSFLGARLDERYRDELLREEDWIYAGGAEGARAVLSTIAGSIITVAGTTFSITVAALSLASGQFGPRLLRNFMRDTGNQVVFGVFTSTFLYCLLVLRTVRGLDDNTNVPHISVTMGVLLAVVSVGVLIYFIHHIAESIQVSHVIEVASQELYDAVSRIFPEEIAEPADEQPPDLSVGMRIAADGDGYLQAVDQDALLEIAGKRDAQIALLRRPGDYVVTGLPVAVVFPRIDAEGAAEIRHAFALGRVRTPYQDAAFAFLQLTDIALRALSPGINDPFTAIMCIDRITSGMSRLASRSLPNPVRRDESGKVRIIAIAYNYEDLVQAGYRHIRESAAGYRQVCAHLRTQLEFMTEQAQEASFRAALHKELAALD